MRVLRRKGDGIAAEERDIRLKTLFLFDVDGTLTESKAAMTESMAEVLRKLLGVCGVAILSAAGHDQLRKQCADHITENDTRRFGHPFVLAPTSGNDIHGYTEGCAWESLYDGPAFGDADVAHIEEAIRKATEEIGYAHPEKTYGEVVENRGKQITFSALGQEAPLEEKIAWNGRNDAVRAELREVLQRMLPEYIVRVGGTTSIDISRGDKGDGVERISRVLDTPVESMLFFGDQLHENGNDHAVFRTGIDAVEVMNHTETERILTTFLNNG